MLKWDRKRRITTARPYHLYNTNIGNVPQLTLMFTLGYVKETLLHRMLPGNWELDLALICKCGWTSNMWRRVVRPQTVNSTEKSVYICLRSSLVLLVAPSVFSFLNLAFINNVSCWIIYNFSIRMIFQKPSLHKISWTP